jgi:hypothetical protein
MEILTAMFGASVDLSIVMLALLALCLAHRVVHGLRVYFRFHGPRLVTCPETRQATVVKVAAKSVGVQAIWDKRCLQLSECSRWPARENCGQECLRQIDARPTALKFSDSCRAS